MSSYQFVNSITSCYGQSRGGPETGSGPCDYYTPQAYNNCYGGVTSVPSGPATGAPPYTAYLQHNGDHHNPHSHHTDRDTIGSGSSGSNVYQTVTGRMPHHPTGGAGLASVLGPSVHHPQPKRTPTPSSCKYASQPVDTASSPQDLSATSTSGPSHMSDRTSPVLASSRSGSATGAGGGSGSGSGGGPGGGGMTNNNQTGSNSENGQANSSQSKGGNFNSNQNQPQIYPWMRKVHVGQSK